LWFTNSYTYEYCLYYYSDGQASSHFYRLALLRPTVVDHPAAHTARQVQIKSKTIRSTAQLDWPIQKHSQLTQRHA